MADAIVQQQSISFGLKNKNNTHQDYSSRSTSSDLITSNMESISINQNMDSGDDFSSSTSDTHSNSSYSSSSTSTNNINMSSTSIQSSHLSNSVGSSTTAPSSPLQQHRQPPSAPQSPSTSAPNMASSSTPSSIISTPKPFPLHEAAFKGEYDKLVSLLLFTQGKNGANNTNSGSSKSSSLANSPMYTANGSSTNGSGIEFVGVNSLDDKKTTPLHHAAFNGHKQCVKLLLASGAYPDVADIDGCTPLHNAAFNGYKSVMVMLIDAGADCKCVDIDGNSALHKAAFSGFHKCAELLLNNGSQVDARDSYGITPLLKAASNKHQKCLSLLIDRGADVNSRDNAESTALHQACYKGSDKAINLLIQKGANVNNIDKEGYSPLHNAVFNGFEECSRILLDKGANIDQTAHDGCTPLHYASSNGFDQCVSLLIRRGCKLDIMDVKRGRTPLHYAANKGHLVCVELLIKAGADTNIQDSNGKLPKNLTKNPEIIALLSIEDKKKSKKSKSKKEKELIDNNNNNSSTNHNENIEELNKQVDGLTSSSSSSSVVVETPIQQQQLNSINNNTNVTNPQQQQQQQQSPNSTGSRSGSTDSLSAGEKESPESTPKLDIYGFVKTSSTVERDEGIRTKKTDKLEKKWAKMCKNWPKFSKSAKLRERLPKGIPSSVRGFVWQRLVNIQEIKNKNSNVTYKQLLEAKPVPAIAAQIQRDLNRTFPKHSFFVEKGGFGQQILCNILTAFSIYNPEVGYCQGMGFITCLLIIYMAEEDAFWVLVQLAEKYGMAGMWMPEFPYLQTCFGIFDTLLENLFPQLFAHIHKQNVFTPLFSSQWFICLLIYNLPFPLIVRIWDLFLYDGLIVIFAATLSLLKIYEDQILKSEFEEILSILKFSGGEEKSLRIDVSSFMKMVVHYKHKIKHIVKEGLIKDPNNHTSSSSNNNGSSNPITTNTTTTNNNNNNSNLNHSSSGTSSSSTPPTSSNEKH